MTSIWTKYEGEATASPSSFKDQIYLVNASSIVLDGRGDLPIGDPLLKRVLPTPEDREEWRNTWRRVDRDALLTVCDGKPAVLFTALFARTLMVAVLLPADTSLKALLESDTQRIALSRRALAQSADTASQAEDRPRLLRDWRIAFHESLLAERSSADMLAVLGIKSRKLAALVGVSLDLDLGALESAAFGLPDWPFFEASLLAFFLAAHRAARGQQVALRGEQRKGDGTVFCLSFQTDQDALPLNALEALADRERGNGTVFELCRKEQEVSLTFSFEHKELSVQGFKHPTW